MTAADRRICQAAHKLMWEMFEAWKEEVELRGNNGQGFFLQDYQHLYDDCLVVMKRGPTQTEEGGR